MSAPSASPQYAQEQLGDVVFVDVPQAGRKVAKGEACAVVESVKAASDIYAPVSGEVVEANAALADTPGDVNAEPMGKGWFFKIKLSDKGELVGPDGRGGLQRFREKPGLNTMRYLPLTPTDRRDMLATIGAKSVDELFKDVPASARLPGKVAGLPDHLGELEVERAFQGFAAKNVSPSTAPFFIGAGAYRHHVPSTVDYMIQRGEFLTSYTPYQPEITQGTLQYLFEFQTQVSLLTGMEVANASMYDGSTGASEAVLMANRITRRTKALISGGLHPHYRAIIETTAHWQGYSAVTAKADAEGLEDLIAKVDKETSCVVVQNPSFFGHVRDFTKLAAACHAAGALLIVVVTEVVSLGLIKPPGEMGADIVVCEGQSIGNGAELRRPLCRPVRHPRQVRAPDAGPPGRRDRRCRRQARLRADPVARASSISAARRRPPTSAPTPASARSPSRCT